MRSRCKPCSGSAADVPTLVTFLAEFRPLVTGDTIQVGGAQPDSEISHEAYQSSLPNPRRVRLSRRRASRFFVPSIATRTLRRRGNQLRRVVRLCLTMDNHAEVPVIIRYLEEHIRSAVLGSSPKEESDHRHVGAPMELEGFARS